MTNHETAFLRGPWKGALLLLALAALAYLPATRCAFIWDDDQHLTAHPCIIGPLGLKEIWTSKYASLCPLVLTTFWMEHRLWGLNPLGYHVVNVLMHAAAALVLWRVLLRLRVRGAWLGAALWALHPVQVASVAWISEMKNTQSGLFFLLSILFYCKWKQGEPGEKHKRRLGAYYGLMLVFGALALASKSSTVVLPLVLGLCAWWLEGRWNWRRDLLELAPLLLLSLVAGVVTMWTQKLEGLGFAEELALSGWQRVVVAGRALWFYLGKLLGPHPLVMVYPRWEISVTSGLAWLPIIAVVVMTAVLWRNRKGWSGRGRALWLAWIYFIVALLPVLGLVKQNYHRFSLVADHFQYLASMGPLALVGAGASTLLENLKKTPRWLATALCSLLLAGLAGLTWRQCAVFENQEALWTATLRENPSCWVGHNNLGFALQEKGQLEEAWMHYQEALRLKANYAEAHNNLGNVLASQGRIEEAQTHYEKALESKPNYALALNNLGNVFQQKGQPDEALSYYQKALDISPGYVSAHLGLGSLLWQKGRMEEAVAHYRKALERNPECLEAHNNIGLALQNSGRLDEAIAQYRKALEIDPGVAAVNKNLGNLLLDSGKPGEAAPYFQKAIEIDPGDSQSLNNLAYVLASSDNARLRDGARAVELAQQASRLTGEGNPTILGTLAAAYAEAGDFPRAVETTQRAIRLAEAQGNAAASNLLQRHLKLYQGAQPLRDKP